MGMMEISDELHAAVIHTDRVLEEGIESTFIFGFGVRVTLSHNSYQNWHHHWRHCYGCKHPLFCPMN